MQETEPYGFPPEETIDPLGERSCWAVFIGCILVFAGIILIWFHEECIFHGGVFLVYTPEYFVLCWLGGILSGWTHFILTPLDLVKCRIQAGQYSSIVEGFRTIWKTEGTVWAYYCGWFPTFIGYSMQGSLKFGLYEYFKYAFTYYGHVNLSLTATYILASACAETIADVALAPWEAVKVKIQTAGSIGHRVCVVMPRMWDDEGISAFFKGLPALWGRQIPYTVANVYDLRKGRELYIHIYPENG